MDPENKKIYKVVNLVGGGSVINGAYPSSFFNCTVLCPLQASRPCWECSPTASSTTAGATQGRSYSGGIFARLLAADLYIC